MTRSSTTRHLIAATLTTLLLTGSGASAASAADTGSNWWYDAYGMDAIHAEGWTGKDVKIAVIDANINPDLPAFQGRNLTVDPRPLCAEATAPTTTQATQDSVHGTTLVAQIIGTGNGAGGIRGIAPDAAVTFYSLGILNNSDACTPSQYPDSLSAIALGLQRAIDDGAQIVATSTTMGAGPDDADVIANAIAKGVVVISTGPNATSTRTMGLGAYRGVVVSSAVDSSGALPKTSDGKPFVETSTTVVAPGVGVSTVGVEGGSWNESRWATGSSFTTPLVAGMLALVNQKYPEATGNQLLQSLVRNTGKEDHTLSNDAASGFGYGLAWPAHMLRNEPSQYPDENLLVSDSQRPPSDQQITAAAQRGSTYPLSAPTSTPAGPPRGYEAGDTQNDGSWTPLLLGAVAGIVVIVIGAGVATMVVLRKQKQRKTGSVS